jgi:hypothetical protein
MVINLTERIMARRQIEALILSDPIYVTLYRQVRRKTSDGAWSLSASTPVEVDGQVKPQQVTLIPFKRRMSEFLVNTELGDVPDLPYVLLGRHNLNIQRHDTFTWQGQQFQVQTVDLKEEVRIAAHIDYFGGSPHG